MNSQQVRQILEEYRLAPNKKLGQNFLISNKIIDQIITSLHVSPTDTILEIGPGLGALTEELAKLAKITVVEIDAGFVKYLDQRFAANSQVSIVHEDFLKLQPLTGHTKLVSNLPYYCSTEILFTIARSYAITEIYIMLQKELGQRIMARPGTKQYGALTITLGFYFDIAILFDIGKNSFYPKPEVNSSFLKLKRKSELPLNEKEREIFHLVVKSAFWGRRKTINRALLETPHISIPAEHVEALFHELNIDKKARAEQLGLDDFIRMAKKLKSKD